MLWGPTYLNISNISEKYKEIAMNKLSNMEKHMKVRGLKNIETYLYSADTDLELLSNARSNLNRLDKIRKNSYHNSLPILKEMFDECL